MKKIITFSFLILIIAGIVFADTQSFWHRATGIGNNLVFRDNNYSSTKGGSVWDRCPQLAALDPGTAFQFYDEYISAVDTVVIWGKKCDAAAHTSAVIDSVGGLIKIEPGATDNDEIYMYQKTTNWKFASGKPFWIEAKLMFIEDPDSTYAANIVFGVVDTTVTGGNILLDNGAGPQASYDGAVFYKVDKGTTWNVETSNGTTQETTASIANRTSGTFTKLGIYYDGVSSVYFYKDGTLEATHSTTLPDGEMRIVFGVKAGAATIYVPLYVDYIKAVQIR